jgi:hypothetical protein
MRSSRLLGEVTTITAAKKIDRGIKKEGIGIRLKEAEFTIHPTIPPTKKKGEIYTTWDFFDKYGFLITFAHGNLIYVTDDVNLPIYDSSSKYDVFFERQNIDFILELLDFQEKDSVIYELNIRDTITLCEHITIRKCPPEYCILTSKKDVISKLVKNCVFISSHQPLAFFTSIHTVFPTGTLLEVIY